jgi:hypothetical protein
MDFVERLNRLLEPVNGKLEDVKWGTMRGQLLTLGTMTDDHLANSRHYHKHLAEVARVAPEIRVEYDECKFSQFLMDQAINSRKAAGAWTVPEDDFRLM